MQIKTKNSSLTKNILKSNNIKNNETL